MFFFLFKQTTSYVMRISDWSSDVCSSDLSLFPVLTVSLAGSAPERTLLRIARDLQDRIESISSVLEAEIVGDRDELLEVIIDPVALESYNLDATDIVEMVTRSEEHTSELQSLMRISYAVFCLKKKKAHTKHTERQNK